MGLLCGAAEVVVGSAGLLAGSGGAADEAASGVMVGLCCVGSVLANEVRDSMRYPVNEEGLLLVGGVCCAAGDGLMLLAMELCKCSRRWTCSTC